LPFFLFFDSLSTRPGRISGPMHQNWHVSAVSAKDVPFGGLDDDQSRLGDQTQQTKILGRE